MKRHLDRAGRGLAGIGLAGLLTYVITTIASGIHNPPYWPYLLCGGIMVGGVVTYFIGNARRDEGVKGAPKSVRDGDASRPNLHRTATKSIPGKTPSMPLPGEGVGAASDRSPEDGAVTEGKYIKARYLLAAVGVVLTALGIWALIALRGRPQALLSALIVIGLVLMAASIFNFKRSAITIELILAVLGVLTLPYTVWTLGGQASSTTEAACTNGNYSNKPIPLKWTPYRTDSYSRFSTRDGVHALYYPDLRWAGYYLPLPSQLCNYKISFFAKEVGPWRNPVVGDGWGYALGVCDRARTSAPFGFSLQYALYQQTTREAIGGFEVVHLPRANTFPNGVGQEPPYPLDYNWHQWTLVVAHNQVQAWFDDDYKVAQENLTGQGLPSNCTSSGIFLRVWGGSAQFHDLAVTANQVRALSAGVDEDSDDRVIRAGLEVLASGELQQCRQLSVGEEGLGLLGNLRLVDPHHRIFLDLALGQQPAEVHAEVA